MKSIITETQKPEYTGLVALPKLAIVVIVDEECSEYGSVVFTDNDNYYLGMRIYIADDVQYPFHGSITLVTE